MPQASLVQYDFKEIQPVFLGKIPIGKIIMCKGRKYYFTERHRNLPDKGNWFQKFDGFGITKVILNRCLKKEIMIDGILIKFRYEGKVSHLKSNVDDWFMKGIDYTDPTVPNKKLAEQKVLPMRYMKEFDADFIMVSKSERNGVKEVKKKDDKKLTNYEVVDVDFIGVKTLRIKPKSISKK